MQDNSIWDKIRSHELIKYDDIERYIYSKEYLSISTPADFINIKEEYNQTLKQYYFEVEEYDDENDYNEVFFQSYLDGDIDLDDYLYHENKFVKMMERLFDTDNVYVYYCLMTEIDNNFPYKQCKDVVLSSNFIENNNDKVVQVKDKEILKDLSILSAREVVNITFIFPSIKSILINSGLHGYLLSENDLDDFLYHEISSILQIKAL